MTKKKNSNDDSKGPVPSHPVLEAMPAALREAVLSVEVHQGQTGLVTRVESVRAILEHLRDDQDFDFLVDVTALDFLNQDTEERFQVIYILERVSDLTVIRLHAWLPEDASGVPSVFDLWDSARWGERECHDMFGIVFEGNPDLRRLLMPEDYPGFPLLKDYPLAGHGERRRFPRVVPVGDEMIEEEPLEYPTSIGRGMHTPEYIEEVRRESSPGEE
ncbi:MAG TPA: NADH-quinone oxidoreductase subunit C [Planctomycetes bacterium]|nr:NADH-quinone oxidoreductase subunit C [Planctomycetota bacterium]HIN80856.1 NADH-quinone oxidoreductase subunit C [Planctomycetota bacterium]